MKPMEVFVNVAISKNEVTPWKDNPVGYKMYSVCHSTEPGPFSKNEKLFREVLPLMPEGDPDCGGNRPMDYISVEDHEAAAVTLEKKQSWDDLTQNEIVVLRHLLKTNEITPDLVFKDRLALIRCVLSHTSTEAESSQGKDVEEMAKEHEKEIEDAAINNSSYIEKDFRRIVDKAEYESFKSGAHFGFTLGRASVQGEIDDSKRLQFYIDNEWIPPRAEIDKIIKELP